MKYMFSQLDNMVSQTATAASWPWTVCDEVANPL
jgi:hypothetical protein